MNLKELSPAIQKAAGPLKPGEISDPVPTTDGFRVLKLVRTDRGRGHPVRHGQDRDSEPAAWRRRGNKAYDEYVEGLRKNAIVDVRVREVPLQVSRPITPHDSPRAPGSRLPTVTHPGAAAGRPAPARATGADPGRRCGDHARRPRRPRSGSLPPGARQPTTRARSPRPRRTEDGSWAGPIASSSGSTPWSRPFPEAEWRPTARWRVSWACPAGARAVGWALRALPERAERPRSRGIASWVTAGGSPRVRAPGPRSSAVGSAPRAFASSAGRVDLARHASPAASDDAHPRQAEALARPMNGEPAHGVGDGLGIHAGCGAARRRVGPRPRAPRAPRPPGPGSPPPTRRRRSPGAFRGGSPSSVGSPPPRRPRISSTFRRGGSKQALGPGRSACSLSARVARSASSSWSGTVSAGRRAAPLGPWPAGRQLLHAPAAEGQRRDLTGRVEGQVDSHEHRGQGDAGAVPARAPARSRAATGCGRRRAGRGGGPRWPRRRPRTPASFNARPRRTAPGGAAGPPGRGPACRRGPTAP